VPVQAARTHRRRHGPARHARVVPAVDQARLVMLGVDAQRPPQRLLPSFHQLYCPPRQSTALKRRLQVPLRSPNIYVSSQAIHTNKFR
jgi:hypothetical protein